MRKNKSPVGRRKFLGVRPTPHESPDKTPSTTGAPPEVPGQAGWLGWALDKLITPLLIGAVLAVFGIFAPPWIADRLQAPTCEDSRDLLLATPDQVEGLSKPTDNFPKKGIVAYGVANLIDGNTSTAWVEGEEELGLGSQFTLRFQSPVDVRLLCVVNGYAESWDLYKRNSRIRLLTIDTQQGTRAALLSDAGSPDRPAVYQPADVPPGKTTYLTMTIKGGICSPTRHHDGPRICRHLYKRGRDLDRTMMPVLVPMPSADRSRRRTCAESRARHIRGAAQCLAQ